MLACMLARRDSCHITEAAMQRDHQSSAGTATVPSAKTVLITGCSSGFGELIAKTLASDRHRVFASMRGISSRNAANAERLRGWARQAGASLEVVELDVTSDESVRRAVKQVLASAGRVDVLVNNAGSSAAGPLEAFSMRQIQALFEVNALGPVRVAKAVLPSMRQRRSGLIIHISSTLGRVLPGSGGLYPATKWALEGLAESLGYEVKAFGIEAVIVEPGAFPSPSISKAVEPQDDQVAAAYAAGTAAVRRPPIEPGPDYRPPDPQQVADAVKRLVDTPAGSRPLRTVVGPIFTEGVAEYNEAYERLKAHLAEVLRRPDQAVTWGRQS